MQLRKTLFLMLLLLGLTQLFTITVVYGDSRSQPLIHKQIVAEIIKFKPTAVFHDGDMVFTGYRQIEYDLLFSIIKPITEISKFYPAIGNHERNRNLFFTNFPELHDQGYYSVVVDSMVFIVLDTSVKISPGSPQFKWLTATLEANKDRPIIIMMHHPVFSSGEHGDELGLSFFLPALLSKYPVLAVFSGHDHLYERSLYDKQWYIVTGGGGAPLYKLSSRNDYSKKIYQGYNFCVLDYKNARLEVRVFGIDGNLIDEFSSIFTKQVTKEETQPK